MERSLTLFKLVTVNGIEIVGVPEDVLAALPKRSYKGLGELPLLLDLDQENLDSGAVADREIDAVEWKSILVDQCYTKRQVEAVEIVDEEEHAAYVAGYSREEFLVMKAKQAAPVEDQIETPVE